HFHFEAIAQPDARRGRRPPRLHACPLRVPDDECRDLPPIAFVPRFPFLQSKAQPSRVPRIRPGPDESEETVALLPESIELLHEREPILVIAGEGQPKLSVEWWRDKILLPPRARSQFQFRRQDFDSLRSGHDKQSRALQLEPSHVDAV